MAGVEIWPGSRRERYAALQGHSGLAECRRADLSRNGDGRGRLVVGWRAGIDDAKTCPDYGFGIDLIRRAQPWTKGEWIDLCKIAITVAGSITFEDHGSRQASRRRVWRCGREVRITAVLLFRVTLIVVAKAVIDRELTADFPAVLGKEAPRVLTYARRRRVGDVTLSTSPSRKLAYANPTVPPLSGSRVEVRQRGFRGAEAVNAIRRRVKKCRHAFEPDFRAELVGWLSLTQGKT